MKTRVIQGMTKQIETGKQTISVSQPGGPPRDIEVFIHVDHDLPKNTVVFSREWETAGGLRPIAGDAMMTFLQKVIDISGGRVYQVTSEERHTPPTGSDGALSNQSHEWRQATWEHLLRTVPGYYMTFEQQCSAWRAAEHVRSFIDFLATMRKNTTDKDVSVAWLRFDVLLRIFYPHDYEELSALNIWSALSRIANALDMKIQRPEFNETDELADRILAHFCERISLGHWGDF